MYFAKHETFHIRDGWLTKGLLIIKEDPRIFLDEQAPEKLGLGKNMVRALRYWMQATGLAIETFGDSKKVQVETTLGELIRTYDTYLELDGSLWLIHYNLVSSKEFATTWYWFFNHYVPIQFTREEFIERLGQWINVQAEVERQVASSSLRKDFDTLTKTYLPDTRSNKSPEDVMESPLIALGLMSLFNVRDEEQNKTIRVYRYESGISENIHPLVFLYVLLDRQEEDREGANQVGLQNVLRERMNVGRTFNIGMTGFEELLGRLNDLYPDWRITLTRTGGLDQLTLPNISKAQVIRTFYEESASITEEVRPCLVQSLN